MNENTVALPSHTWRDRLRWKLFPAKHCDCPEAPAHFKGSVVTQILISVSALDRLRILFSGRAEVNLKVITEHEPGNTRSLSTFHACPPKFLDRQVRDCGGSQTKAAV